MKIFVAISCMALFFTASAFAHRIVAPSDPGKRCSDKVMDPEKCALRRQNALDTGCITQEEFDALTSYNSYPTCINLTGETGLDQLEGWCACGCFHPDTRLAIDHAFSDTSPDQVPAKEIVYNRRKFLVKTLSSESELNDMQLENHKIALTTVGRANKPVVYIKTDDGSELTLTETHPVITITGKAIQAKEIRPGDAILRIDGNQAEVVQKDIINYQGNVVNLATEAGFKDFAGHVIFGEDLAIGDLTMEAILEFYRRSTEIRQ
jgi:hypothetical protein